MWSHHVGGDHEVTMRDIVFLFAGQGSQFFLMAEKLYVTEGEFRRCVDYFDQIFKNKTGESLISYLYDKNRSVSMPMDDILYSNPAIFMIEVSLARTLISYGICPDAVIGESMGEFAASAIAGIIDENELFEALIDISYEIREYCPRGRMMAILENNSVYYQNDWMWENSTIVADNCERHFVISGEETSINMIKNELQKEKIAAVILPVLYSFHTGFIEPMRDILRERMDKLVYKNSKIKYISGESGQQIFDFNSDYYWNVVRNKMHFQEAMGMIDVSKTLIVDVSPSGTLANLAKMNYLHGNSIYSVISLFRNDDKLLKEVLDRFREEGG